MTNLAVRYPLLHRPDRWEWASITMHFTTKIPCDDVVASTHVVGFVGGEVVLCRDDRKGWFLPGGTLEEAMNRAVSDNVWAGELLQLAAEIRGL